MTDAAPPARTGFVLVDKPRGPTSHDVVDRVRRVFGVRRVGHAGTLDPLATGLLVVAVGPATRLASYVQGLPKTYDVTACLGVRTSTLDADGDVTSREDVDVDPARLREAVAAFVGEIDQIPPAVSAVKVEGERAYRRARRGETVDVKPRRVTVYSFDVLRTSPDAFDARVVCSTGTYIRSLIADVGDRLSCGAHVAHLRRTAIGDLDVRAATKLDALEPAHLRSAADVLTHLPRVDVDDATARVARFGRPIPGDAPDGTTLVTTGGDTVGIFDARDGVLRPVTVLGPPS